MILCDPYHTAGSELLPSEPRPSGSVTRDRLLTSVEVLELVAGKPWNRCCATSRFVGRRADRANESKTATDLSHAARSVAARRSAKCSTGIGSIGTAGSDAAGCECHRLRELCSAVRASRRRSVLLAKTGSAETRKPLRQAQGGERRTTLRCSLGCYGAAPLGPCAASLTASLPSFLLLELGRGGLRCCGCGRPASP